MELDPFGFWIRFAIVIVGVCLRMEFPAFHGWLFVVVTGTETVHILWYRAVWYIIVIVVIGNAIVVVANFHSIA